MTLFVINTIYYGGVKCVPFHLSMSGLSTFSLNFTSMDYICRRDKKALQHYDFLWEVMEENLKGINKKKAFITS